MGKKFFGLFGKGEEENYTKESLMDLVRQKKAELKGQIKNPYEAATANPTTPAPHTPMFRPRVRTEILPSNKAEPRSNRITKTNGPKAAKTEGGGLTKEALQKVVAEIRKKNPEKIEQKIQTYLDKRKYQ